MSPRRDHGAAIVLAMLLAALAAAVAASVFADQERWGQSVLHRRDQVQAQALAMAGVQWARQILDEDARTTRIDHLGEPWALPLPPIPLDRGEIRGAIADAQGRLNLNALADASAAHGVERERLARLFAERAGPAAALPTLAEWLGAAGAGAGDARYRARTPPGLAADAPAVRVAEIARVDGVALPALRAVLSDLAALPVGTPVNVNTASPAVLQAIFERAGAEDIAAIVAGRAQKPFTTVAEFRARLPAAVQLRTEEALDVKSRFFLVSVEARQGETVARARALVRRDPDVRPVVVWESVE